MNRHTLKFGGIWPSLTINRYLNSPGSPCPVAVGVASDFLQSRSWNNTVGLCESWTSIGPNFPGDWIRTSGKPLHHRSFQPPFRNLTVKKTSSWTELGTISDSNHCPLDMRWQSFHYRLFPQTFHVIWRNFFSFPFPRSQAKQPVWSIH